MVRRLSCLVRTRSIPHVPIESYVWSTAYVWSVWCCKIFHQNWKGYGREHAQRRLESISNILMFGVNVLEMLDVLRYTFYSLPKCTQRHMHSSIALHTYPDYEQWSYDKRKMCSNLNKWRTLFVCQTPNERRRGRRERERAFMFRGVSYL